VVEASKIDPEVDSPTRRQQASGDLPPEVAAELSPERQRVARRCLVILGLLATGSLVGVASSIYLVSHYPLLLIALSPIGRHLILVAPIVDPVAFLVVAVTRRVAFCIPCFFLGRAMGRYALQWLEARAPRSARFIHWIERLFERASYAVVFLLPGAPASILAGDAGMRPGAFLALLLAGLLLRMAIVIWIGDLLRGPIEEVLVWVRAYWLPGTIILVAAIALRRRPSGSQSRP
jgi:membrane protein DedA with SNARE-associated domain